MIPEGVTSITSDSFSGCSSLREIYIPSTVSNITSSAFSRCGILNIVVSENNNTYSSKDGVMFDKQKTTLIRYAKDGIQPDYVVPSGVTIINNGAFMHCHSLISVIIPEGMKEIKTSAFANCDKLKTITLPSSITTIGNYAFQLCSDLIEVSCYALVAPTIAATDVFTRGYFTLKVPVLATGYTENNWSRFLEHFTIAHEYEPTECASLNIAAYDVNGRKTTTKIYWTAMTNGTDLMLNQAVSGVELSGIAISEPFPQNTSTTDTVQREISFTYLGTTESITITQGVWVEYDYTLDLNDEWRESSAIANPDAALYDGVYESDSNWHGVSGTTAIMYIDIEGYETFKLYLRSYGYSSYNFAMVSQLDKAISYSTSYSNTTLVKAHTRSNQQSGVDVSSYTLVEYTGIDKGKHRITVMYRKGSNNNSNDDRAYLLIPKN